MFVHRLWILTFLAFLVSCSKPPPAVPTKALPDTKPATSVINPAHPLAKYLELVAFRMADKGPGKLQVGLAVVNHSEADIGELTLKVRLTTSASKPEDPPVTEFQVKVPALGPKELKEVTAPATTKLRGFELPDWQFLRAEAEILSPAP